VENFHFETCVVFYLELLSSILMKWTSFLYSVRVQKVTEVLYTFQCQSVSKRILCGIDNT